MMRKSIAVGAVAVGMLFDVSAETARADTDYPWCASGGDGYVDCSFATLAQCQQTASGIGGCFRNPRTLNYPDQARQAPPSRRRP